MRFSLWIVLFACICCFAQETRDTVFVEVITRDTVYIPIKPKTDTVYAITPTPSQPPVDTVKQIENDSNFTLYRLRLYFDLLGGLISFTSQPAINTSAEFALNRKNSILLNYAFAKKSPSNDYSETFNDWIYKGNIKQHAIGLSYRHYIFPMKRSLLLEIGNSLLIRQSDFINTWDDTELINDRPQSDDKTHYGYQFHIHLGNIFRGERVAFALEYGIAYNAVPSFDDGVLDKHFMFITPGYQINLLVNLGFGIL